MIRDGEIDVSRIDWIDSARDDVYADWIDSARDDVYAHVPLQGQGTVGAIRRSS
jgi:hypothetical protein